MGLVLMWAATSPEATKHRISGKKRRKRFEKSHKIPTDNVNNRRYGQNHAYCQVFVYKILSKSPMYHKSKQQRQYTLVLPVAPIVNQGKQLKSKKTPKKVFVIGKAPYENEADFVSVKVNHVMGIHLPFK